MLLNSTADIFNIFLALVIHSSKSAVMDEFLNICLSEEDMDAQEICNSLPNRYPRNPLLKRFVGHDEEILQPTYISQGETRHYFQVRTPEADSCVSNWYVTLCKYTLLLCTNCSKHPS